MVRRERTNTPMQALLLLNDPQYVEAARGLAERVLSESHVSDRDRAERLWRICLGRFPEGGELEDLTNAYQEELSFFGEREEAAKGLIGIGDVPPVGGSDPAKLAAWTTVASLVLNLDEVVTKN